MTSKAYSSSSSLPSSGRDCSSSSSSSDSCLRFRGPTMRCVWGKNVGGGEEEGWKKGEVEVGATCGWGFGEFSGGNAGAELQSSKSRVRSPDWSTARRSRLKSWHIGLGIILLFD